MSANRRSWLAVGLTMVVIICAFVLRSAVVEAPLDRLTQAGEGTVEYTGSWHFPRGGPYVLGFESREPTKLYIGDRLILQGKGLKTKRIVYQPGDYAVRIESPGWVRLVWHPPGRRGPVEYVPASSLARSTDSPTFERPGTSWGDGFCVLVIIVSLLGCILYLARESLRRCDRSVLVGFVAIAVGALAIRLIGLDDQGQTWDEDVNWSAGRNYITNILNGDFAEQSWRWNFEHPPVMKYLAGIGAQFTDGYTASRAISALLVAVACGLLVPIGARLFHLRVGILAGVFAALTPHIIAHSKVVGHEAPTLLLWTLAIWLALRAHDPFDDPWRLHKRFAVIGVVLGLAVSSRYINGLLAPLVGLILILQAPKEHRTKTLSLGVSILPLVAVVTCVLVWPRLWSEPLLHLEESWDKLKKPHSAEPYLGVMTNQPPWSYFLTYLWATAPIGILLAMVAYVLRLVHLREAKMSVVLLWFLVPLAVMLSPVRQDGVRYVMPSLLAMNIAAALGVDYLARQAARFLRPGITFSVLGAALSIYLAIVCIRIHPFYLDYYGEQVGGPQAVAKHRRFEIAWWGEGMNQALDYLNEHAPLGAKVYKQCFQPGHLAWMRGDLWAGEVRDPKKAEWLLVYQPSIRHCPVPGDAELAFEVRAQGAPLARVYRRVLHP